MKLQPKFYLMSRLLSLIGAALILLPLTATAQALTGPDLRVTKVCVNGPNQSVLCTVTVNNNGQVASVAPLSFTDTPTAPPGSTYTGAGGSLPISCSLGAGPVLPISCTANKSMQPNESGTALFSFTVPQGGTFRNCVTVSQGQNAATLPDPNLANNTNICTTISVPPPPPPPGPITIITPRPSGACTSQTVVSGMHYPNQSCAQTTPGFLAGMLTSFHFTSKCPTGTQLLGVINASCQNAPIPGFPTGSVYQGTACCGTVAPPPGKITVIKKIINNNAGIATPGPFEVQVKCNPNVPYSSVSLTGPSFQHSINLPAGGNCKIEEVPPKAPPGCTWITTYPNGQTGKVGDTLVVQNELKCESCPPGQNDTAVPGYCCDGKPGSEKFCCWKKK